MAGPVYALDRDVFMGLIDLVNYEIIFRWY